MIGRSRHRSFERTCLSCKRQFTFTLHNKKKQYCDRKCAGIARRAGGQIAQKVDETTLRNHGVKRVFQDTERIKKTLLDRYGVEHITQVPGLGKANWLKAHETKKKNGTYASSRIERAFCERLAEQGVKFDVQVEVFGRPIDVVIDDVYVQIDGRYWHGLDRPIDVIKNSTYARDKTIYARWMSDRQQDEQFAAHGLRLVRVTDQEAKEWLSQRKTLQDLIRNRLQMRSMT